MIENRLKKLIDLFIVYNLNKLIIIRLYLLYLKASLYTYVYQTKFDIHIHTK